MIDTHCHLDQFESPQTLLADCEARNIKVVAVTNLPSHYAMALPHISGSKSIKLALGLHPLMVQSSSEELPAFLRLVETTRFIGEIGLDYSKQGIASKSEQIACFEKICASLRGGRRFISIHSRGAVSDVIGMLKKYAVGPVIFHWFTGTTTQLAELLSNGHYVSINPAMLNSHTGRNVLQLAPRDRVLTETDAPFTRLHGKPTHPADVDLVIKSLATTWMVSEKVVADQIDFNFDSLTKARGI